MRIWDLRTQRRPSPATEVDVAPFAVKTSTDGGHRVVRISGELDLATRNLVSQACLANGDNTVVVEMSEMTFMDCSGYGGLVAARHVLQEHGGSLTLSNETGQPARLLTMLALLEPTRPR